MKTARISALAPVAARYAVGVTPAVAVLVDPDDSDEPIARQFIPDKADAPKVLILRRYLPLLLRRRRR